MVIPHVTDEELSYHSNNSTLSSRGRYRLWGGYSPDVGPGRLCGAALLKGWVVQCSLQPQLSLEQSGIISVYELTFFYAKGRTCKTMLKVCLPLNGRMQL